MVHQAVFVSLQYCPTVLLGVLFILITEKKYMNEIINFRDNTAHQSRIPDFFARRVAHFYRERVQKTWNGGHILRGRLPQKGDVLLFSNDYLSLSNHQRIVEAQAEALRHQGNGVMMSAIFLHGPNPQRVVEERFAAYLQAGGTILTQSGWCANVGLIQTIADEQTPVYVDMLAHMSLWEGGRAANAKIVRFRHNDPDHLERLIRQHGPGVVMVDSVYSTNGSLCPLVEVTEIASRHGCVLVVDESHSLGTHGPKGAGLVVELGLTDKVHFRTASLAKAFCGRAGLITCTREFQDYFAFTSLPAIFSSALLPHDLAGLSAALDVIAEADDRRRRLHCNAAYLRQQLDALGYNIDDSQSQIIALEAGPEPQTIVLRDALESNGVFGAVFCDPATPKNRSIMRLSIHSELGRDDLNKIVDVCAKIRRQVGLQEWPSTKRKQRGMLAMTA